MALILKGGILITEKKILKGDLKIENEIISLISENININNNDEVIDIKNKIVMPGIIDSHVHYKMHKDKVCTIDLFETGSKSAICGGVTTVIDYAEQIKGLNLVDSLKYRIKEAENHSFVDYSFHMSISGCLKYDLKELKLLKKHGINSLKLYTTYKSFLNYKQIKEILIEAKKINMIVTIHAEDNKILNKNIAELKKNNKKDVKYYNKSRSVEAEIKAVKKIIKFCKNYNLSAHIVHVSSGYTGKLIKEAQKKGVDITAETCPHYLILNEKLYNNLNAPLFVMQPPLRTEKERKILWKQVQDKIFKFITTDHCAYSIQQKFFSRKFYEIDGGIPGSETLLPIIWSEGVSKKRITELYCMELLSLNPSKFFGLYPKKGTLKVGSDADIVVIDPDKEVTINKKLIHTAADYSPFEGIKLKGYPIITILRGKIAFKDNKFCLSNSEGKFVRIIKK